MIRATCEFRFGNPVELCSLHGLVRGENMELGRDSDTGGQVRASFHSSLPVRVHNGFSNSCSTQSVFCYTSIAVGIDLEHV